MRLDEIEPDLRRRRHAAVAARSSNARHRRVRDQRLRRAERRRRRRGGAHGKLARARRDLPRARRTSDVHPRRRDARRARRARSCSSATRRCGGMRGRRSRRPPCSPSAALAARRTSRRPGRTSSRRERHRASGDYDAYASELEDALVRRPDHPADALQRSRAPRRSPGARTTRSGTCERALDLKPEWLEMAQNDDDLVSLRDLPGWPAGVRPD